MLLPMVKGLQWPSSLLEHHGPGRKRCHATSPMPTNSHYANAKISSSRSMRSVSSSAACVAAPGRCGAACRRATASRSSAASGAHGGSSQVVTRSIGTYSCTPNALRREPHPFFSQLQAGDDLDQHHVDSPAITCDTTNAAAALPCFHAMFPPAC